MANSRSGKKSFRRLEQQLTVFVGADLALFALYLLSAGLGILWLKILTAIAILTLSFLGAGFLVLIEEHKQRRSYWLIAAFGALFLCCLVSLICGYPAPALA